VCYRDQFDAKLQIEVLAEFMTEQAQTQCLKVSPRWLNTIFLSLIFIITVKKTDE